MEFINTFKVLVTVPHDLFKNGGNISIGTK